MNSALNKLRGQNEALKSKLVIAEQQNAETFVAYHQHTGEYHINQYKLREYSDNAQMHINEINALHQKNCKLELELLKLEALLQVKDEDAQHESLPEIRNKINAVILEQSCIKAYVEDVNRQISIASQKIEELQQQNEEWMMKCRKEQEARDEYLALINSNLLQS